MIVKEGESDESDRGKGGREDVGWGVDRMEEGGVGLTSSCSYVQVSL